MTRVLIISGAQKSASTSVAKWFADHDAVRDLSARECMAFEGRTHALRTQLIKSKVARVIKDGFVPLLKRPEIFHNETVQQRAATSFPGAVAVVILRNPVDRSVSAWDHYRRMGVIDPELRLRDCVARWREARNGSPATQIISYSLYSDSIRGMLSSFRSPTVVFHEDLLQDPRQSLHPVVEELQLKREFAKVLPRLNTREDGAKWRALPPKLSGTVAYRWDNAEQLVLPRMLGWRAVAAGRTVALALGHMEPDDGIVVTDEDRNAVFEAVESDLDRLEIHLARPLPSEWRSG